MSTMVSRHLAERGPVRTRRPLPRGAMGLAVLVSITAALAAGSPEAPSDGMRAAVAFAPVTLRV